MIPVFIWDYQMKMRVTTIGVNVYRSMLGEEPENSYLSTSTQCWINYINMYMILEGGISIPILQMWKASHWLIK